MKWSKFSKLSAFARAESHLVQQTTHGALVTLGGCLLALILFGAELREHFKPHVEETMSVDATREKLVDFSFDITFPSLPCQVLSLDLRDASGEFSSDQNIAHGGAIHKFRLDRNGKRIGHGEFIKPQPEGFFMQRRREDVDNMNRGVEAHEGCHLFGYMSVQRVAGNFHISVHVDDYMMLAQTQMNIQKQLQQQQMDMGHTLGIVEFPSDPGVVNVSHIFKKVAFGPSYPGQINPLDGLHRIVDHDAGTFKYFIKIVPTEYRPLRGKRVVTNQYSVTEYWTKNPQGDMSLPSVWVVYDVSAISVVVAQRRRSLLHLLVRFCAVVGGGFAVTGLMDRLVHSLVVAASGKQPRKFAAQ